MFSARVIKYAVGYVMGGMSGAVECHAGRIGPSKLSCGQGRVQQTAMVCKVSVCKTNSLQCKALIKYVLNE